MAEAPPPPSSPPPPPQAPSGNQQQQYWCYQCDKRVLVNTEGVDDGGIACRECNNGFVESIAAAPAATIDAADFVDDLGSQFLQVLRLIAQASRDGVGEGEGDDEVPPPPPPESRRRGMGWERGRAIDEDFLRIELDGWQNDDEDDYEEDEDEDDEGAEIEDDVHEDVEDDDDDDEEEEEEEEEEFEDGEQMEDGDESETEHDGVEVNNDENNGGAVILGGEEEGEEAVRRRRRNRFLDWAEILMGLDNNTIELRVELPETDNYFADPRNYVDAAGFEALLQNLAESDQTGRRGAPAAAKSAITELPSVVIADGEAEACAICKDGVNVGDEVKQLPCGHGYHDECIVLWLGFRNSCPVCRYELPTDDPEYEDERKKKLGATAAAGASGSGVL